MVFKTLLGRRGPRAQVGGKAADSGAGHASVRAATTFAARLTFEGIERTFDDTVALAGVSLDIAPGEVVCLLGPSGCGKTTLLRIAAGIERPTGGRVLINDQEVAGPQRFVPPEERNVGLMFQDFALFPHLDVQDNVAFGLVEQGVRRADARAQARELLQRFGLADHARSRVWTLSGGEQQRVALARALITRPRVLLLDEPFSALDAALRVQLREEFARHILDAGMSALLVTHDESEARAMAQSAWQLEGGRLQPLW